MVLLGEELRRERELREISLREISESTKISMRILEAIENDNYKILPGGVFNRNFLRAYAEFVGLDGESIVNKYQRLTESSQQDVPPIWVPPSEEKASWYSNKAIVYVGIGILMIVLLLLILGFRK